MTYYFSLATNLIICHAFYNIHMVNYMSCFSLIMFKRHCCIYNFHFWYVLILILWQGDHGRMPQDGCGKSSMVMNEVNVSFIVPNSINVIVTIIHDYITYVNIWHFFCYWAQYFNMISFLLYCGRGSVLWAHLELLDRCSWLS